MIDRILVMDDAHLDAGRLVRVRADVRADPGGEHRSVYRQRFASVCMCGRPVNSAGCSRCRWGIACGAVFQDEPIHFDPNEFAEQPPAKRPRKRGHKPNTWRPPAPPAQPRIQSSTGLSESELAAFARAESYRR